MAKGLLSGATPLSRGRGVGGEVLLKPVLEPGIRHNYGAPVGHMGAAPNTLGKSMRYVPDSQLPYQLVLPDPVPSLPPQVNSLADQEKIAFTSPLNGQDGI
jgi:hypothetical protein